MGKQNQQNITFLSKAPAVVSGDVGFTAPWSVTERVFRTAPAGRSLRADVVGGAARHRR